MLRALEDPGIVGDMLTSAAAYDPIFWPLHGTVERLLAYKRTVVRLGLGPAQLSDFNEDWGFPEFKIANNDPYLNGVCDWSKVKGPTDLTLPTCSLGEGPISVSAVSYTASLTIIFILQERAVWGTARRMSFGCSSSPKRRTWSLPTEDFMSIFDLGMTTYPTFTTPTTSTTVASRDIHFWSSS